MDRNYILGSLKTIKRHIKGAESSIKHSVPPDWEFTRALEAVDELLEYFEKEKT